MSEPITNLEDAVRELGALPMPVGSGPRTLDVVEDELTGVNLSLFEEELENARLRLALASAKRGRRELRARVSELEAQREADHKTWQHDLRTARAEREAMAVRIGELEAERADAVDVSEKLSRALHDEMLAGSALYAALTMPTTPQQRQAALDRFTAVAQRHGQAHAPSTADGITRQIAPTQALREDDVSTQVRKLRSLLAGQRAVVEDPHDSPLRHDYRVPRDLPETGGGS